MFGKKGTNVATPLEKSDIKAFLGPGSQFEGKLVFTEIVRLDGVFRGEINSKDTLIVGQTGELHAEITVGTLILSGKLKGNVSATARVELRAPAQVEGNIATPLLTVEEGVVFNGSLEMQKPAAPETGKKS
ncbi:protein CcmA, bactofilin family [Geoalkalibacter ferrihydriticus]|uniref:Protein CcmA, bactofilin family n=1 Tax=Geoalkalibacter ferrihydriticus TaxID=392333 RepID=A0A1G9MFV2_9BACT|nr:polymer-forming cytoskeletal protein [Geoalkalibacter ferrihydriticus]SDL72871.1 protein CcmA, bactofilin family [Geoalkalibacter ferrihydriticus]